MSIRPQLAGCPGLQVSEGGYHFPLPGEGALGTVIKPPRSELALARKLWLGGLPSRLCFPAPPVQSGDTVALVPSPPIPLTVNFPIGLSVHVSEMGPCPLPTLPDPSSRIPDNGRLMGGERAAATPLGPGSVSLSRASPQSPALVGTRGQSRRPAGGGGW